MSYYSNSNQSINPDPRITKANLIIEFINDTCRFCAGYSMPTQEIHQKYVRYCRDRGEVASTFNVFARSFKYFAYHNHMVPNLLYTKINYFHDKPGVGYIKRNGWGYVNITVNY